MLHLRKIFQTVSILFRVFARVDAKAEAGVKARVDAR